MIKRLFISALISVVTSTVANAYSCGSHGYKSDLKQAQHVFIGKVLKIDNTSTEVRSLESFKGVKKMELRLTFTSTAIKFQTKPTLLLNHDYLFILLKKEVLDSDSGILEFEACDQALDVDNFTTKKRIEYLRSEDYKSDKPIDRKDIGARKRFSNPVDQNKK